MTLEEIKDQVAYEYEWIDWMCFLSDCPDHEKDVVIDEVAQRYAQSQTQVLQEQNAELVDLVKRCRDVIYAYSDYRPTATGNEILQAIQDRLTKYNHLKSNTN